MYKSREDRFSSAQQLVEALKGIREGTGGEDAPQRDSSIIKKDTERRYATVLVAEIPGYDDMQAAGMEPEEAAVSINQRLASLAAVAEKYNCGITKIMGSVLVSFFGVPSAIEEAPKAAVNAAIEMRALSRMHAENKGPVDCFDIRIGINSGLVIAGSFNRENQNDYSVMGDTVTIASLLKDSAVYGHVLTGSATQKHTSGVFDYKPLSPLAPGSRKNPVSPFQLLSSRPVNQRREFAKERRIFSHLVGREKELDKLKLHLLKAINGEGSIVSVIGEAGIGKSRLISELKALEDTGKLRLLEGMSLWRGGSMSYQPIIDIIKQWAGIKDDESDEEMFVRLEQAIAVSCPGRVGEILPFVGTLMGVSLPGKIRDRLSSIEGSALAKLIQKSIRELLIEGAIVSPIICIMHDIHWADISSIELVESLLRLVENHPILFIQIMRPGFSETGERILETSRRKFPDSHTEIHLNPLDNVQCESLIRNLLKARVLPEKIIQAIVTRAGGNPFFIEEVLHSFIDDGVMELREGVCKITSGIDSVVIPETIQDVVMARIDKLDNATRSLLKIASVVGRFFFNKILSVVAGDITDIARRLNHLKEIRL
ncbi:MAG: AAA family ATPase, partial [bacterium]|nr:AAA family ATPase [bacterium]